MGCEPTMNVIVDANSDSDAHVGQQLGAEGGREVPAAVRVGPKAAGRDSAAGGAADEELARDDGAEGAVVVAASRKS